MRRLASVDRWIKVLIGLNAILIGSVAFGLLTNLMTSAAGHPDQAPLSSASPSPPLIEMGLAHIPTNNDCVLCHDANGYVGLRVVPAILHPIEGWRRCVTCHTNPDLGRTAPGHEGIAEEECLNCHKTGEAGPAITQPHAALHDQACLDCHGSVAHLPSSMATTDQSDCVLCHKPAQLPPPTYPHAADAQLSCRTCHQSAQVGGLPIDHALRADRTCLLCHDIMRDDQSPALTPPQPTGSPDVTSITTPIHWPLVHWR